MSTYGTCEKIGLVPPPNLLQQIWRVRIQRCIRRTRHKFSDCIALYIRVVFLNFTATILSFTTRNSFQTKRAYVPARIPRIGHRAQHRGWRFSRDLYRRKSPVHTSWTAQADKNGKGNFVVSCALLRGESQSEDLVDPAGLVFVSTGF